MEDEARSVQIPIKTIVEQAMQRNGARYEEDEFNLLRKYFIACLNLGYLTPNDLVTMVNKFASRIKIIVLNYHNVNKMDYYMINNNVLYIAGHLKDSNEAFYEINFYKAVTEAIFNADDTHIGFSNAICNMAAEKIYNMDVNDMRIIMPKTDYDMQGNVKITLRAGYMNYNLIISLLKQLLISKGLNENRIIHDMYFKGYAEVLNSILDDSTSQLILEVLDKITIMYINRKVRNTPNESEKVLTDKYQIILNDSFKMVDQNYLAFCALITTDELREKLLSKKNNE